MVSRVYKSVAAVVAAVSIAGVASANCGSGLYCGQSHASYSQPIQAGEDQAGLGTLPQRNMHLRKAIQR